MKKLSIVLITLLLLTITASQAQSTYKAAVGVRVGSPTSASLKAFLFPAGAIEVHAGFSGLANYSYYNYFSTGIMYQHHFPIGSVQGLRWYVGGGALAEFYSYDKDWPYRDDYAKVGIGIHAVGGVEYKFSRIPLAVSADFMPTFFPGDTYYDFRSYGGVAARYVFKY